MNKMTLTAKIKIMPTTEQAEQLLQTVRTYRDACNEVSQFVFESKRMSTMFLHKQYYRHLRQSYSLRSQMAQSVLKTVVARYKSLNSNHHPWIRVQFKKPEYDLVWHRFICKACSYRSNDDRIAAMNLQRIGMKYIAEVIA